ncbi:RNA polymerase sigma factor SigJ, partial [Mycobacterium sp. ITM-2017-0098]
AEHAEVVGKLLAAMASGDLSAVVALLHPEVTFTGDSNRRAPTAARVIHGSDKVARFLLGLARRYGDQRLVESGVLGLVNGELGIYSPGADATDSWPAIAPRIQALAVADGRVVAIYDIANPDKFTGSPLR